MDRNFIVQLFKGIYQEVFGVVPTFSVASFSNSELVNRIENLRSNKARYL
jgi:hypothetical protein